MAITLDDIVNKEFKVAKNNGYDRQEVEAFLDEILAEMEQREAQANQLRKQVETLTQELEVARSQAQAAPVAPAAPAVQEAPVKPVSGDRYSAESFELVLTKAKGAYEEIVAAADSRAAEIVEKANEEAAAIRSNAQTQMADLTKKLSDLRKQTGDYYAAVKKLMDEQSASMEQIKKML